MIERVGVIAGKVDVPALAPQPHQPSTASS